QVAQYSTSTHQRVGNHSSKPALLAFLLAQIACAIPRGVDMAPFGIWQMTLVSVASAPVAEQASRQKKERFLNSLRNRSQDSPLLSRGQLEAHVLLGQRDAPEAKVAVHVGHHFHMLTADQRRIAKCAASENAARTKYTKNTCASFCSGSQ